MAESTAASQMNKKLECMETEPQLRGRMESSHPAMTASSKMGFGADLQGRTSHEALLKLQDAEIKLLEMMRRMVTARVEADRQYVANLTKMVGYATKGDNSDLLEFQDCCSVFRAWDTQLKETEKFIKLVKDNCETLATRTLDSLTFLIAEKKSARKSYLDQRNQLDSQILKSQEDVQKNKTEYSRLMDRLKVEQAKYQDAQNKGKAGAKLDEAKSKMVRTMTRLHGQHNDYVIAVHQANALHTSHGQRILPTTLNCHQSLQEVYVRHVKFVFQDYARLTDFTAEPFQEVSRQVSQSLDRVEPGNEYGSGFIGKYKSEPLDPIKFEFDQNLLADYSGPLKASQLELDDLTFEALRHRKSKVEEELKAEQKALEMHRKRSQDLVRAVGILEQDFTEHQTSDLIKELVEQRKQGEVEKKEVELSESSVLQLESVLEIISQPLTALGDASPPSALESPTGEVADTSVDTESNFSTSSKDKEKKGFKLPSKLTAVNPFKKDKANGKVKASREDLAGSGDEVEKRARTTNGADRLGSYEQTDPVGVSPTSNGPASRTSMAAMREGGTVLTDNMAVPKRRFEDEEWFHGVLPREEVQRLLVEDGDYLVRESKNRKTNETQYVLSVFWQGHKHFIIQGAEEVGWRFEGSSYPTIRELIEEQHSSGQPVTNKSQAILQKAILREDWELLNDHIHLEMKIGNGNFGEVYKGVYTPKNMVVAVKTCRDTLSEDQRKKFLQEGRILKQYNHPNIVSFIGIAAQRQPVMIVMEFVSGGALLSFLRKQGKQQTKRQLTQMCVDAANGMAYLESRGCIHRDLAARNCLVGENSVIKISDFGMSREEEEYTVSEGMKQIPIKWTAPEALNFGKYTMLCDVWSFGILMWEIFSAGQQPYPGMTNAQAREKIEDGYRLPQNPQTPDPVYKLMLRCWEYNPDKRPRFKDIYDSLKDCVRRL